ncbi:TSUP family transporter [Brachybacterium sp. YJGR34]|uniref:TSUP family transporter n=1 Tax=Brachybacterium sp. YJGR34 TaxID=2059911 RepID=UPI000E0A4EB7|nr:TSUP family transporter [Brachybacterium sp. YJGR34]
MSLTVELALIGLVLACAIIQRVAGMGLGIVFAPYAVVLIGAHEGIMLANLLGGLVPLAILPRVWSRIDWKTVLWLGLPAVAVMPGAAWLSSISPPPAPLYLVVASLVLLSLLISLLLARVDRTVDGRTAQVVTGIGTGLGTVLGGVGGPAVTVYAVLSRWPALPMVATLQPLWILVSLGSFGTKWAWDDGQLPHLPWWVWLAMLTAVVVSVGLGEKVQRRLPENGIQRLVIVLGFLGAALSLSTGMRLLLG